MQVHENHYMKCAGVAGLRVRAQAQMEVRLVKFRYQ